MNMMRTAMLMAAMTALFLVVGALLGGQNWPGARNCRCRAST